MTPLRKIRRNLESEAIFGTGELSAPRVIVAAMDGESPITPSLRWFDGLQYGTANGIQATMTATITIDAAGRFVLPKSMRERLHLMPGAKLKAEIVADKIELTPEPDEAVKLVRKGKRLVLTKKGTPFDSAAAIRSEREGMETIGARR